MQPEAQDVSRHANHLAHEKSPYLLAHAHNPVDWYPWGEEAWARAEREDRPVFLSIGYSSCHWCHVMAEESFEDNEVAALLNGGFVCIKVDREERPDIDHTYLQACQMLTGQGGWPLTVVLTPEKQPFFAATYLPRERRYGQPGLLDLLPRITAAWREQRAELLRSAEKIADALLTERAMPTAGLSPRDLIDDGFSDLVVRFDPVNGGFGTAPKFPAPLAIIFLLRYSVWSGNPHALDMATYSLDAMARGGIHDQLGGGFHRYATDAQWRVPHFEKMLTDQALLLMAYTEAWAATNNSSYRATAGAIAQYVSAALTSEEGLFFTAEDADSRGGEGAFYLWSREDLIPVLGDDDAAFAGIAFGLAPAGQGNVLYLPRDRDTLAASLAIPRELLEDRLAGIRQRLLAARKARPRPATDDKILTDANGLMIAALAQAARTFGSAACRDAAVRAMDALLKLLRNERGILLHRSWRGSSGIAGFASDYAAVIFALTELYETTFETRYLGLARDLALQMAARFRDPVSGIFFSVAEDAETPLARPIEIGDTAVPSPNALALENLQRLAALCGDPDFGEQAETLTRSAGGLLRHAPSASAAFLSALLRGLGQGTEAVVAGHRGERDTEELIAVLRTGYRPGLLILLHDPGDPSMADLRISQEKP